MTIEASEALGHRAVATKWFRWMPGMRAIRTLFGPGVTAARCEADDEASYDDEGEVVPGWTPDVYAANVGGQTLPGIGPWLPDLADPATLGCLLALVREAWGPVCDGVVVVESDGPRGGFFVVTEHDGSVQRFKCVGGTRSERLVAALEAAPQ